MHHEQMLKISAHVTVVMVKGVNQYQKAVLIYHHVMEFLVYLPAERIFQAAVIVQAKVLKQIVKPQQVLPQLPLLLK